jgi:hypothetical protein
MGDTHENVVEKLRKIIGYQEQCRVYLELISACKESPRPMK